MYNLRSKTRPQNNEGNKTRCQNGSINNKLINSMWSKISTTPIIGNNCTNIALDQLREKPSTPRKRIGFKQENK